MQKIQNKNMPHIVLNGIVNLEYITSKFEPILQNGKPLIKINDMFVHNQKLQWAIPLTDPQKTDAVKKSLMLIFEFIKKYYPSHKITKTTLHNFILDVSIT